MGFSETEYRRSSIGSRHPPLWSCRGSPFVGLVDEMVQRVDEHDQALAVVGRGKAVRHGWLHRIAVTVCRDREGRILVQRRSEDVARFPGHYEVASGGAVVSGESPRCTAVEAAGSSRRPLFAATVVGAIAVAGASAPRMNAHCERVIDTVRREALDDVLLMNEAHARQVLADSERHYNAHRPHRARDQSPPHASGQPATSHDLDSHRLLRTHIPGGAINEYQYAP
jgi:hypothetical protein